MSEHQEDAAKLQTGYMSAMRSGKTLVMENAKLKESLRLAESDCKITRGFADARLKKMNELKAEVEKLTKEKDAAEALAAGVEEGAAEWEEDCKEAQARVKDLEADNARVIAANVAGLERAQTAEARVTELEDIIKADPDDQALYLLRWILKKWGITEGADHLDVMGAMHVAHSHAHGYMRYITSYRCDDKQGEIARQAALIEQYEVALQEVDTEIAAYEPEARGEDSPLGHLWKIITDALAAKPKNPITFDELVEHGKANGGNIVNGMPWSFTYHGHAITHEDDNCYIVPVGDGDARFERGSMLAVDGVGDLVVVKDGVKL